MPIITLTDKDYRDPDDCVYTVTANDANTDSTIETVLCGGCICRGNVMVIEKHPNFSKPCELCGRSAPDLRPVLKPKCDCHPPVYRMELGHREDKTGESVPCILLACDHPPCTAHMLIDFDWPTRGKPMFDNMHEGY